MIPIFYWQCGVVFIFNGIVWIWGSLKQDLKGNNNIKYNITLNVQAVSNDNLTTMLKIELTSTHTKNNHYFGNY